MTTEPKPETPDSRPWYDYGPLANKQVRIAIVGLLAALLGVSLADEAKQAVGMKSADTPAAVAQVGDEPAFVVKLEGQTEITRGGYFVKVIAPDAAIIHQLHKLPAGNFVADMRDFSGQRMLCNFQPTDGEHLFRVVAQLPQDGADPFAVAEHLVTVGAPVVVPPVVVPPVQPPPITIPPPVNPVEPLTPVAPTSVTYVYEKDDTAIPAGVLTGLNRLNRERKILATAYEQDTTDGTGDTPEQYKLAKAEALKVGLPALVVVAGSAVVRVVRAPTTEEQVWGAAL